MIKRVQSVRLVHALNSIHGDSPAEYCLTLVVSELLNASPTKAARRFHVNIVAAHGQCLMGWIRVGFRCFFPAETRSCLDQRRNVWDRHGDRYSVKATVHRRWFRSWDRMLGHDPGHGNSCRYTIAGCWGSLTMGQIYTDLQKPRARGIGRPRAIARDSVHK